MTYKILRQPTADPTFQSIAANTAAHCVFAHIRAASGATAITTYNNHPFTFGRHAFMHNGVVAHYETQEYEAHLAEEISEIAERSGTAESVALVDGFAGRG